MIVVLILTAAYQFLLVCREEAGELGSEGQVFTSARGAMVIIAGMVLIAFHFLVQVAIDLVYVIGGRTPPPVWVAEAGHGEPVDDSRGVD